MGFVDYFSRYPSGEPIPVSLDDKSFVIGSVNQISTLLGFEQLMPRYTWPQIRKKFSQQILNHDITYCNTIAHVTNNMKSQELVHEKRIVNAAETLQAIFTQSKISVCQNLHSRTEDCTPILQNC